MIYMLHISIYYIYLLTMAREYMVVIISWLNGRMIAAIKVFACESLVNSEIEQKKEVRSMWKEIEMFPWGSV